MIAREAVVVVAAALHVLAERTPQSARLLLGEIDSIADHGEASFHDRGVTLTVALGSASVAAAMVLTSNVRRRMTHRTRINRTGISTVNDVLRTRLTRALHRLRCASSHAKVAELADALA
jgi:hypothetical protein